MSSMKPVSLAAAAGGKMGTFESPVLWTILALVAALLLGAALIALISRWRKRPKQDQRTESGDQLSTFRSLYDRGELTREEYEQIRAKLGAKLRKEMNIPSPDAPNPPTAADSPKPPEPPGTGQPNA